VRSPSVSRPEQSRNVGERGAAFVEWWATFDCAADEGERWTRYFACEGFAKWLGALREFIRNGGEGAERNGSAELRVR